MRCDFCGSQSNRVKYVLRDDGRTRCKSEASCRRRMTQRPQVRAVMAESVKQDAMIGEFLARRRNVRNALYVHGLCCDCGARPYSSGRPRCEPCHAKLIEWRKYGYG